MYCQATLIFSRAWKCKCTKTCGLHSLQLPHFHTLTEMQCVREKKEKNVCDFYVDSSHQKTHHVNNTTQTYPIIFIFSVTCFQSWGCVGKAPLPHMGLLWFHSQAVISFQQWELNCKQCFIGLGKLKMIIFPSEPLFDSITRMRIQK